MAVRLFVGNLWYTATEAELRAHFSTVAPPSQVVLPVDRDTGRPRGFAFVEFAERSHAEQAIQKFNGQMFSGRPLAVSEARAREDRGPGGPRPGGGFSGPRPGGGGGFGGPRPPSFGGPRTFDPSGAPAPPRNRNFGPDARPQRGNSAKKGKKDAEKPRGPIPLKRTGRSLSLDDDSPDDATLVDVDDFATSRPDATGDTGDAGDAGDAGDTGDTGEAADDESDQD